MRLDWDDLGDILGGIKGELKEKLGHDIPLTEETIKNVSEKADKVFNPIEALDETQVKAYNDLKAVKLELDELVKLKEKFEKLNAKYKNLNNYLTSSVELKHDLSNKVWRINEKTGMIEVFSNDLAKEQLKEFGLDEILPAGLFGGNDE